MGFKLYYSFVASFKVLHSLDRPTGTVLAFSTEEGGSFT